MSPHPVISDTAVEPGPTRVARTLREGFAIFGTHLTPVLIMLMTLGLITARVVVGGWRWQQLVIVGAVLVVQPFIEWTTHVWVLHARPRRIFGREVDMYVARKHRRHHADPRNLEILAMPVPGLITLSLVTSGVAALLGTWGDRLTLGAVAALQLLVYEWIHFLIHTDYKPKTAAYRRLYVNHRLHHFRNENFWYGVSRLGADRVLGTGPAKHDVPLSATCKSILG